MSRTSGGKRPCLKKNAGEIERLQKAHEDLRNELQEYALVIRQAEADAAEVQEELRKLEREALVLGADLEKGDMSIEGGVREAIRSSRVMKRLDVEKPKKSGCYWYRFDLLRGDILPRYYDCATDAWHVAEQPNMDDVCEPPVHWLEMEPPPVVPEGRK